MNIIKLIAVLLALAALSNILQTLAGKNDDCIYKSKPNSQILPR
jgi:hypothetical protein